MDLDQLEDTDTFDIDELQDILNKWENNNKNYINIINDINIICLQNKLKMKQMSKSVEINIEKDNKKEEEMNEIRKSLNEIKVTTNKYIELQKELSLLKIAHEDLNQEFIKLNDDRSNVIKKFEENDEEKLILIRDLKSQHDDLKSRNDIFEFQRDADKQKIEDLKKQIKDFKEKEVTLINDMKLLKQQHIKDMETTKQKYEDQIMSSSLKSHQEIWKQKANQMQIENADLKLKLSKLEEKLLENSSKNANPLIGSKRKLVPFNQVSIKNQSLREWD